MNTERAHQIIAAYGGDPARWPADEREAGLACLAADAGLRAAQAEARGLDTMLDGWARRGRFDVCGGDAAAAAERVLRPARGWRLAAGSGLAAAVALVFMAGPLRPPAPGPVVAATTISDEAAFAVLFTPTPYEENTI